MEKTKREAVWGECPGENRAPSPPPDWRTPSFTGIWGVVWHSGGLCLVSEGQLAADPSCLRPTQQSTEAGPERIQRLPSNLIASRNKSQDIQIYLARQQGRIENTWPPRQDSQAGKEAENTALKDNIM